MNPELELMVPGAWPRECAAREALRKARGGACCDDLPWHGDDDYDDPGHDACTSALLDGFTVEEITEAGG